MNELQKKGNVLMEFCSRNSGNIEKIAVVLLCAGLCLFHYHVREYRADTLVFQKYLEQYSFFGFLTWRAETWSGRLVLEGILYIILKLPYLVFAVLDSFIILGTVYGLRTLLEWKRLETTVFMLLLLVFSMEGLIEVGIQPGAINYTWALAAAVIAMIPLEMVYREKNIRWYHYIGFGTAALIGCNMEQTAAIVFCFYVLAAVYFGVHRKLKPIVFSQIIISVLSIVFLMTCTGNAARLEQETAHYWPGFENLSVIEKLGNGWFTTVNYFYTMRDIPFIVFVAVLCVWLWLKYRRINVFTVCGTIPILFRFGIWMGKIPDVILGTDIRGWANGVHYENDVLAAPPIPVYPQVILYTILFLLICVAVLGCSKSAAESILILLILSAGLATRLLMGFSPTLIASGIRTYFFMDVALCLVATGYVRKIWGALSIASLHKFR